MSLSAYALTSLAALKRHLRIDDADTSEDSLLEDVVNAVTLEIERVCGVQFMARDYRERYNGHLQRCLVLRHFPVNSVTKLSYGDAAAIRVTYSGTDILATVGANATGLRLYSVAAAGTATTSTLAYATYPTASTLVTAINAISGWTATLAADCSAYDLNPMGGTNAKTVTVDLTYPDCYDLTYWVDYDRGLIVVNDDGNSLHLWDRNRAIDYYRRDQFDRGLRMPRGFQYLLCQYNAGYSTVPADVQLVCHRLCQDAYYEGLTARGVTSSTMGPFAWKAAAGVEGAIRMDLAYYIDLAKSIGEGR